MNMTRILIVGSRNYNKYEELKQAWQAYIDKHGLRNEKITIVSGGAQGADKLAERLAKEEGLPIEIHRPDWQQHGKSAGMIRNAEMVQKAQHLIALWDGTSKGTAMTIRTAQRKGLTIKIVQPPAKQAEWEQLALYGPPTTTA